MPDELEPLELQEALHTLRERLPLLQENILLTSQLLWTAYAALTKQGFSEDQALELVCARGWNL